MTKTCFAFVRIQATRSSKSAQGASFLKRAVKKKKKKEIHRTLRQLSTVKHLTRNGNNWCFLHNNEIKKTFSIPFPPPSFTTVNTNISQSLPALFSVGRSVGRSVQARFFLSFF